RRAPGHGRKRERLEAIFPGEGRDPAGPGGVAVIGAGIAGASVMRALRRLGVEPVHFEAEAPGAGASGNPAGLVTPRLDAGLGPVARLAAQAYLRALDVYPEVPGAMLARGVLQLAATDRDPSRFARIAGSDLFPEGTLRLLDPAGASARLGEPSDRAGLDQPDALSLDPRQVLEAWCGAPLAGQVQALERAEGGWRLTAASGETSVFRTVILAAGAGERLEVGLVVGLGHLGGGLTAPEGRPEQEAIGEGGGYLAPLSNGFLFGATFRRGETSTEVTEADHQANLEALARARPALAADLSGRALEGRARVRATTRDHLPLAGALPGTPGLLVLGGLGSRGLTWAPLLGEHIAALATGAPSPLPEDLAALLAPGRYSAG
ncbi:MAG: FAD-dependent 5-carboxymethylaminomethyl-2-thiouridine(34) oxidoreductase MnmC, partial [Phenylobacterium sp.]|uniref:FAD-dependent 5-carboxymethylaminomethyl-2-thiouridine(34) oxidoreductase MnmC n=1 Tax=Phenylobacterium sp. TaxID=1871053 RepID=UPI003018B647